MKAIADTDLSILQDAARKWMDATLSRQEHKVISDVLTRLMVGEKKPTPTYSLPTTYSL